MVPRISILFTCLSIYIGSLSAQKVILTIPDGEIMGSVQTTPTNATYFSFRGIPYAKPPINELRYQAPQPVEPWNETLDATYDKSICFQVPFDDDAESEDCLHLNVFVPRDSFSNWPLPVIVFIHGGAFLQGSGSAESYGPQHFMEYDVIIVSFNYRLGPFGFFSTGDSAIPGNAGLKDQNMVLKWVQKNIQYFGGDPNKVTIFGASSGAASVAYHILSSKSKDLFRGAICMSGSALNPLAYQRDQVYYTFRTAGAINPLYDRNNMSSSELLEFATNIMASVIDKGSYEILQRASPDNIQEQQGIYYAPVIEHDHEDAFITKKMYEEYKNGNINSVPLLIGANTAEMLNHFTDDYLNTIAQTFDGDLSLLVPRNMHIEDESVKENVGTEIKNIYSPNSTFEENITNLIKFFDDTCFLRGIRKQAELHSNFNTVYSYQFSYSGPLGGKINESVEGFSDIVTHGEELGYLFVRNYDNYNTSDLSQFSEKDVLVHKRLITMFTNFAKILNPTPEDSELLENIIWPIVNGADFAYLDIGSSSEVKVHPKEDTYTVWENIYSEYGVPPFDTY